MNTDATQELGFWPAISFALLPGALIAAVYFITAPEFVRAGLPPFFALLLSIGAVLIPFEIGVLLRAAKKVTGRYAILGAIPWTKPMPVLRFLVLVGILLVWNFAVFILLSRFDRFLVARLFSWFPNWALPPLNLYPAPNTYSASVTSIAIAAGLIFAGVAAPVVEEFYFRGFLLPRMRFAGRYAPLVNAVLFSAYHFTLPWHFISRAIAVAPVAFIAARTKNVYVGMTTHILLNVLSAILILGHH